MLQLKDDSVISHNTVKVLLKEMLSGNKKTPKQVGILLSKKKKKR